ncbi:hypothetical protein GQ55_1G308400 [Panicum hallii var. hallii]|uniref:Uncharacterized protein n=1 Tax=Panicum hallii var. hallii TaxID=1504633 RepID=A0A2T7F9A2_9POAL|nr:hypothetical protein GQ55_1G308400 [Panicum hallii var. hallii]
MDDESLRSGKRRRRDCLPRATAKPASSSFNGAATRSSRFVRRTGAPLPASTPCLLAAGLRRVAELVLGPRLIVMVSRACCWDRPWNGRR